MPIDAHTFTAAFVTLIVILDPPGAIPIYLALTHTLSSKQKAAAARRASLVALGVIASFAVFGQQILNYLHISLAALQGSGGLLLLLVALDLLTGTESDGFGEAGVNVALVPLGTPLLAGPGAIVATMLAVQGASTPPEYAAVGLALVAALGVVFVVMRFSGQLHRLLRPSGIMLLTKIAGLLLAAIAVQMIADSVRAFISGAPA